VQYGVTTPLNRAEANSVTEDDDCSVWITLDGYVKRDIVIHTVTFTSDAFDPNTDGSVNEEFLNEMSVQLLIKYVALFAMAHNE